MGSDTIVLVEILSLVGVCTAAAGIKAWFEVYRELRWRKTSGKDNESNMGRQSRNRHFFFRTRDPREQELDYMAASMIMPREKFWNDLTEADYFNLSPKARREFVYRAAQKYNVETSMVFRRISELKIMME